MEISPFLLRQRLERKMDLRCYGAATEKELPPSDRARTIRGPIFEKLTNFYKNPPDTSEEERLSCGAFCFYADPGSGKTTAALQFINETREFENSPKGCMVYLKVNETDLERRDVGCYQQLCTHLVGQQVNHRHLALQMGEIMRAKNLRDKKSILILDHLDRWDGDIADFLRSFIDQCLNNRIILVIFTQSKEVADKALFLNHFSRMQDFPYTTNIDPKLLSKEDFKVPTREDGYYDVEWKQMRLSPRETARMLKKRLSEVVEELTDEQMSEWFSFIGNEDWKPADAIKRALRIYEQEFCTELEYTPSSKSNLLGYLA